MSRSHTADAVATASLPRLPTALLDGTAAADPDRPRFRRPGPAQAAAARGRRSRLRHPDRHPGGRHPGPAGRPRHHRCRADRHRQDRRLRHAAARLDRTATAACRPWCSPRPANSRCRSPRRSPRSRRTCRRSPWSPIYGGASFLPQRAALKAGAQVVVGTPGRIIDHLERGTLDLSGLKFLVLDEADEMLRMGFAEDVDRILTDAPGERQTALFSATMPPAIRSIAAQAPDRPDRHRGLPAVLHRRRRPADLRDRPVPGQGRRADPDPAGRRGRRHHRLRPHQGRLRPGRRRPASPAGSPRPR